MTNNQRTDPTDMSTIKLNESQTKKTVRAFQLKDGKNITLTVDQKKLLKFANNRLAVIRRLVTGWKPLSNSGNALLVEATKNGNGNPWKAGVYIKSVPISFIRKNSVNTNTVKYWNGKSSNPGVNNKSVPVMVIRGQSGNEIMVKYWDGKGFKYFYNK